MGELFNSLGGLGGDPLFVALNAMNESTVSSVWNDDGSGIITRTYGNGNSKVNIYGPRLKNLNVAFSDYGKTIPISFGVRRLDGETIWGSPLTERSHKKTQTTVSSATSGNGATLDLPGLYDGWASAPTTKTVTRTFFYFSSFAVSFGYGDPTAVDKEVVRIWANGKLIYDAGSVTSDVFEGIPRKLFPQLNFQFYPGSYTQTADPTIMDYENRKYEIANSLAAGTGPNLVPGYRGQMYLVFKDFPLAAFNNSIPNIQVELADVTSRTVFTDSYDGIGALSPSFRDELVGVDWPSATLYSFYGGHLLTIDMSSNTVVNDVVPDQTYRQWCYSPATGKMYACRVDLDGITVWQIDPISGFGTEFAAASATAGIGPFVSHFILAGRLIATPVIDLGGTISDQLYLQTADGGSTMFNCNANTIIYAFGGGHDLEENFIPGELSTVPVFYWVYDNAVHKYLGTRTSSDGGTGSFVLLYTPPGGWFVKGLMFSEKDRALFIALNDASLVATEGRLVCIRSDNGHVNWDIRSLPVWSQFLNTYDSDVYSSDMTGGNLTIPNSSKTITVRIADGSIIFNAATGGVTADNTVGSGNYRATFGLPSPYFYDKPVVGRTTLAAFILFAAALAGLDTTPITGQIEVDSAIDDIAIDGAYITDVHLSFRDLLDDLKVGFMFDVIESDTVIRCVKRAEDSAPTDFTLAEKDLLVTAEGQSAMLVVNRESDDNIPRKLTYNFLDFQRGYSPNLVYAQRNDFPDPTNFSKAEMTVTVPIIFREAEAKEWAYKILFGLWRARNGYSFRVAPLEMTIEPGDAGTVTSQSRLFQVKVEKIHYNADFSMSIDASSFVTDFPLTVTTDTPFWETPQLQFQTQTQAIILDIPDPYPAANEWELDTAVRAKVLVMAGPQLPHRQWPGGYVQFISSAGTYATILTVVDNQVFSARVITPPSAITGTVWSIDTASQMVLRLDDATNSFVTLSDLDFLNTTFNTLLVGNEILRFRDATDLGSGQWLLTHLARGLRGTDNYIGSHSAAERVYMLVAQNYFTQRFPRTRDNRPRTLNYRSSSFGGLEGYNARYTSISFIGRSNLPFSPVHVHATASGSNLIISFQPRSRAPGTDLLPEGDPEVELGAWETTEDFEIDFYSAADFLTVLGTVSDDATEGINASFVTMTLDAAKRTSVLGSSTMPSVVYAKLYQVSAEWGRGVARTVTLNVE